MVRRATLEYYRVTVLELLLEENDWLKAQHFNRTQGMGKGGFGAGAGNSSSAFGVGSTASSGSHAGSVPASSANSAPRGMSAALPARRPVARSCAAPVSSNAKPGLDTAAAAGVFPGAGSTPGHPAAPARPSNDPKQEPGYDVEHPVFETQSVIHALAVGLSCDPSLHAWVPDTQHAASPAAASSKHWDRDLTPLPARDAQLLVKALRQQLQVR